MTIKVLHVPFHFTPGQLGGTEIYVVSLCKCLTTLGVESAIAAAAQSNGISIIDDTSVYYFGLDTQAGFEQAQGRADEVAAKNFRAVLVTWRPDVVHLHARSSAVSELLVDEARHAGCKVVYTYHTPTASCARGTMMLWGRVPCDGKLDVTRCTDCVLQSHGLPFIPRILLARVPDRFGKLIASFGRQGGVWTALRMRSLQSEGQQRFRDFARKIDKVVAVCDWVAEVLRRNGVSEPKLVVSRQGLPYQPSFWRSTYIAGSEHERERTNSDPLRICYFGRIDPTKGVDVLVRALRAIPHANVMLDIYGILQGEASAYQMELDSLIARDPRIEFKAPLAADLVVTAMGEYDLVAVTSLLLETGPLVVLEAFAAGTPVIGSRLGGIAELVRDGVDGVLVDAGAIGPWAQTISDLESNRDRLQALCSNIRPPRTALQVTQDMKCLYEGLM